MELRSLLFSRNERVAKILSLLLKDLSIEVVLCQDLEEAQQKLWEKKFDGIFADCELEEAPELLRSFRRSKHNKRSIAFAIVERETRLGVPFRSGAHFVIHKPLSVESSKRTLRAAHGLMMREKRNYYRHDISTSAMLRTFGKHPMHVLLLDLCKSGALIESKLLVKKGQVVNLRFSLPETRQEISVEGLVRWADATGRAGIEFQVVPESSRRALAEWTKRFSVEDERGDWMEAEKGITTYIEKVRTVDLR